MPVRYQRSGIHKFETGVGQALKAILTLGHIL